MSLRTYNSAGLPRHMVFVNDAGQAAAVTGGTKKITVLGCNNRPIAGANAMPLLAPFSALALSPDKFRELSSNFDAGTSTSYPSELSIAVAELQAAGYQNIEIVRIGSHDRLWDITARHATLRYIMLENAYNALVDASVDIVYPVNVFQGLKGDKSYSALNYEYVLDLSKPGVIGGGLDPLQLPYFRLTTAADGAEYNKGVQAVAENLVYQLADFCYTSTRYNRSAFGLVLTPSVNQLKMLKRINLTNSVLWQLVGGTASFTAATTVTFDELGAALDAEQVVAGAYDTTSTTLADGLGSINESQLEPMNGTVAQGAIAGGVKINDIVKAATSLTDLETKLGVRLKSYSYANATHPTATFALAKAVYAGPNTELIVWLKAAFRWLMLYGTPTAAELSMAIKHLEGYGSQVYDEVGNVALRSAGVEQAAIASFADYDGVTAADGKNPDNYLFYATSNHQLPSALTDVSILLDASGNKADVGPYIETLFAHSQGVTPITASMRPTAPIANVSGLGAQAVLHEQLPAYEAITNKATVAIRAVPFAQLSKSQAARLGRQRIQSFYTKSNGYVLSDGMTGAMHLNDIVRSDYVRSMTRDIVFDWASNVRNIADPFTGLGLTPANLASLEQKINVRMQQFKEIGALLDGSIQLVNAPGAQTLGQLTIRSSLNVPGEIREIIHEISLV